MVPSLRAQFMIREVDAAKVVNVPARELCAAVGMDNTLIDDPIAMLPLRQIAEVYTQAARRTGDDALGLHVGERCGTSIVDLINYAIISRPTLAKAYEDLKPLIARLYPEGELTISVRDAVAVFRYRMDPGEAEINRHRCEAFLASIMKLARHALGREEPLRAVAFQHRRPKDISEHLRIFQGPVSFSWPANEMHFSAHWLRAPLATADSNLCAVLDRHLSDLLARIPNAQTFSHDVRRRLLGSLRSGQVNLSGVAKGLAVSARTLQRRLEEEGTSLQKLIEESRYELSLALLRNSHLSLTEIAQRLGYATPASFSRAFRRWRGISPVAYRKTDRSVSRAE
jgi:AraC-like DNA-binding protein